MKKHSCDTEIRSNDWAMSGHRKNGELWTCSCRSIYERVNDEAEGSYWQDVTLITRAKRRIEQALQVGQGG